MGRAGTKKASDWREERRKRAWALKDLGWKQSDIAVALGVTEGAVSQWLKKAREQGPDALLAVPHPGKEPQLSEEQLKRLRTLLEQGAQEHGFFGDFWTTGRVALLIESAFGIRHHRAHMSRILRKVGWSLQKPVVRAFQRKEEAVREWKERDWPAHKKSRTAGAHARVRRRDGAVSNSVRHPNVRTVRSDTGSSGPRHP